MVDDVFDLDTILPEGFRAVNMIAAIQVIDPDGEIALVTFQSQNLPTWTAMGMLTTTLDDLRHGSQEHVHEGEEE